MEIESFIQSIEQQLIHAPYKQAQTHPLHRLRLPDESKHSVKFQMNCTNVKN